MVTPLLNAGGDPTLKAAQTGAPTTKTTTTAQPAPTMTPTTSAPQPMVQPTPYRGVLGGFAAQTGGQIGTPTPSALSSAGGPAATGVTTANTPLPPSTGALPPGASTTGTSGYANTTPITVGGPTDLTSQLITPGKQTDFLQSAKDQLNAFNALNSANLNSNIRDATRSAAATGALGSGHLNTDIGNLTNAYNLNSNNAEQQFLANALGQQNANNYANLGILQQQQGFQAGQQNNAFNQGVLQNEVGNMNNPDTLLAELSGQYNQQAGQAASGVGQLAQASNAANQNGQVPSWLQQLLSSSMGSGGFSLPSSPNTLTSGSPIPTTLPWNTLSYPQNPLSVTG